VKYYWVVRKNRHSSFSVLFKEADKRRDFPLGVYHQEAPNGKCSQKNVRTLKSPHVVGYFFTLSFMENGLLPTSSERIYRGTEPQYRDGTQKQRILNLIRSRPFVSLPEIMDLRIADYHRVMDFLKDDWYLIECDAHKNHVTYIFRWFDATKKKKRLSLYWQIWHAITGIGK